jgi:hypothetical protein
MAAEVCGLRTLRTMKHKLIAAALSVVASSTVANAAVVTVPFSIDCEPAVQAEQKYGEFGRFEGDAFHSFVGARIVESRLTVHFQLDPIPPIHNGVVTAFDPALLRLQILVPVIADAGAETDTLFRFDGSDLVPNAHGEWDAEITTDDFNGLIRAGRFSLNVLAMDENGEVVPLSGAFVNGSGFYFTVNTPEPATAGVAASVLSLLGRHKRR